MTKPFTSVAAMMLMVSVLMTQGAPGPARGDTGALFRQMVRQAIVDQRGLTR
jgi:hypothetical protein